LLQRAAVYLAKMLVLLVILAI